MNHRVTTAVLALALSSSQAWAWGSRAHQLVTSAAVDALPGGLKGFYSRHRLEIPSLNPDFKGAPDSPERRFAVDKLLPFPFRDLPRKEEEMLARYGENGKTAGRLPYLVKESFDRLVTAMQGSDKDVILSESDTLSQLVAELHNPLALAENADGQKTGQPGLWVRFAERFPARSPRLNKLNGDAAYLIDDPAGYVYSIIPSSYIWLDNILYFDELAHRQDASYGGIYYEMLDERAANLLRDKLNRAARDVSSYWYTAWIKAGKPELK